MSFRAPVDVGALLRLHAMVVLVQPEGKVVCSSTGEVSRPLVTAWQPSNLGITHVERDVTAVT